MGLASSTEVMLEEVANTNTIITLWVNIIITLAEVIVTLSEVMLAEANTIITQSEVMLAEVMLAEANIVITLSEVMLAEANTIITLSEDKVHHSLPMCVACPMQLVSFGPGGGALSSLSSCVMDDSLSQGEKGITGMGTHV